MPSSSEALVTTRRGLHAVAEQILAAARYRATGHIGLVAARGGFATPPFLRDGTECRLAVIGTDLVVADARGERSALLSTLRAAGELAELVPGAPDIYPAATAVDLDAPLGIEPGSARTLADWFALVDEALRRLTAGGPPAAQLWPEHFDLAISLDEVNFGGSPGDADHEEPYLYVGPYAPPPVGGFWNESFGASLPSLEVPNLESALAFFETGRSHAAGR
ncbi:MAG: hypothetical protein ACLP01_15100 [Solirubrobacteraceae bacterium]